MVRIGECPACQIGDHKRHIKHYHPVPEGMMGGAMCPCKGECEKDRPRKIRDFLRRTGMRS